MGLLTALWRATWRVRAAAETRRPEGESFPDFTLRDTTGRPHALSSGGPTVLWFTNLCEDCQSRAPLLGEMVDAGLRVLAVSILPPDDPLPLEYGKTAPFPVLLDPEDVVGRQLGLEHPPCSSAITSRPSIRRRFGASGKTCSTSQGGRSEVACDCPRPVHGIAPRRRRLLRAHRA